MTWSSDSLAEVGRRLSTNLESGLRHDEAQKRQAYYGKNTFQDGRRYTLTRAIMRQFKNPLLIILLVAGIVTLILNEYIDTIVIFIALAITVGVDIFQERRTDNTFQKLKESQQKEALVLRDGKKMQILAEELVPGDVIFLEAGMVIPADARLITDSELLVNESTLTGEWVDVSKDASKKNVVGSITEQVTMVWMGTLVSSGVGMAVVVATGASTQLGVIAESLTEEIDNVTPLQKSIRKLARFLAIVVLVIIAILVVIGIITGKMIGEMLLIAVAIAVAATPSGLPAAVTVVLVLGMEHILKRKGLVRNLLAAETLGSTTIILTDKTGTLTQAKMTVTNVVTGIDLKEGEESDTTMVVSHDDGRAVLSMAVMSSDAFVESTGESENPFVVHGRPVEKAIVSAGLEEGMNQSVLLHEEPQVDFVPFDSKRKVSAALHKTATSDLRMVVVGAPELAIEKSSTILVKGKVRTMTKKAREALVAFQEAQGAGGARLIGVAFKVATQKAFTAQTNNGQELLAPDFTFGGFIVLDDPIREGVVEAIKTAQNSGIRVIMATGDHATTGRRIAQEVGIFREGDRVLTGDDVEQMKDKELLEALGTTTVFARVLPQQKLRIAKLLKGRGDVVAMTGDGVNDAPALRSADIGVALGSGTDVAKEASDLILLDNGFDVIVYAIEEGRRIVDNLKKITAYLLSTGFSEIVIVGGALLFAAPLPLLPAQILWINIIEEGFMNFAFAFEPKEKGLMRRRPLKTASNILTPKLRRLVVIIASVTGAFLLALYAILLAFLGREEIDMIRTVMFIALSVDSIFFSLSLKDLHNPLWRINLFSNRYLVISLVGSLALLFLALALPPLRALLSLESLSLGLFFLFIIFGIINVLTIEVVKFYVFGRRKK